MFKNILFFLFLLSFFHDFTDLTSAAIVIEVIQQLSDKSIGKI